MDAALITPTYAAIFALVFVSLSVRALLLRRRSHTAIGHGNRAGLERAVRAHGNFAEYVPIALLLLYFLEVTVENAAWVHGLCVTLLAGRLVHAYGISQIDEDYRFRVLGMALTFTAIISASLALLNAAFA